jgi:hypothetical protein
MGRNITVRPSAGAARWATLSPPAIHISVRAGFNDSRRTKNDYQNEKQEPQDFCHRLFHAYKELYCVPCLIGMPKSLPGPYDTFLAAEEGAASDREKRKLSLPADSGTSRATSAPIRRRGQRIWKTRISFWKAGSNRLVGGLRAAPFCLDTSGLFGPLSCSLKVSRVVDLIGFPISLLSFGPRASRRSCCGA